MEKPFKQLKKYLLDHDVDQSIRTKFLGELLGKGDAYIRARMAGRMSWTFDDAARIAHALNIPREQWADVFYVQVER